MYLIDTNVVSELRNPRRTNPSVRAWVDSVDLDLQYLSVISLQELEIGTLLIERRDKQQGVLLRKWLENQILPAFTHRILSVDLPVAMRSAALQVPNPRPYRDALIAATALVHDLTVVTRNTADFAPTGVALLNPWEF